jgi:succinyl-diaminopimelate desuccinylase
VSQPEPELTETQRPDLLALAAEIVEVPSVSHEESELADAVEADLTGLASLAVERIGDTVVARTDLGRERRVVLAGHLDTVPGDAARGGRLEGDVLRGLGAVDMKGGLAVMLALAATVSEPALDVTYVFYPCEEVGWKDNGLGLLASSRPELLAGDAAVLGEPTGGFLEAGCQGTLHAVVSVGGIRAHTARPFTGVNAVHRLASLLTVLASYESRKVVLDGCEYAEQLQAVKVEGGIANNVVPDRATLRINYRFAPDRTPKDAELEFLSMVEPLLDASCGDSVDLIEAMPGAPPSLGDPTIGHLLCATGRPPRAKVGWTDVATFAALGIPAANFGPGDPLLAHTDDEHVGRDELEYVYDVLRQVLTTPASLSST